MPDRQGITDSSQRPSRTNGQLAARVHVMQTGQSSPASPPKVTSQPLAELWHQSNRWWQNDGPSLLIQQRRWPSFVKRGMWRVCCLHKFVHRNVSVFRLLLFGTSLVLLPYMLADAPCGEDLQGLMLNPSLWSQDSSLKCIEAYCTLAMFIKVFIQYIYNNSISSWFPRH